MIGRVCWLVRSVESLQYSAAWRRLRSEHFLVESYFYARQHPYAMAILSVRLSVCPSVTRAWIVSPRRFAQQTMGVRTFSVIMWRV